MVVGNRHFWQHRRGLNPLTYLALVYFFMKRNRLLKKRVHTSIASTPILAAYLKRQGFSQVKVVPYPTDIKKVEPCFEQIQDKTFLYAGQLEDNKGVQQLIEEFHTAWQQDQQIKLLIAGTGSLQNKINKRIHQLKLTHHITLLGWTNVNHYYPKITALISPSIWSDNDPLVVQEAMAKYRPVIGSNRGGMLHSIKHNTTGLIIDPTKPGQLAHAILKLTNTPLAKKMGLAARKRIETLNANQNNIYQLYEKIGKEVRKQ